MALVATLNGNSEIQGPPIRPSRPTWVYFFAVNSTNVKVGYSAQDRGKRLQQHRASKLGVTVDVEPLCELIGSRSDEQAIHRHFGKLLLDGECEVFRADESLIEYVRWLRDQYFVVVPEMTELEVRDVPAVPSSEWLPSTERRKRKPTQTHLAFGSTVFDLGCREITGDDYYTNEAIIAAARSVLGHIDLDPASHAVANRNVKASRFYSVNDDGLGQSWSGRVWCNPPFGDWQRWAGKIVSEWNSGRISEMCVLAATRTITAQCMVPLIGACNAIALTRGRMPFWGPHATSSPDDGHFIAYFGTKPKLFGLHFREICTVFYTGANQ